MCRSVCLFDTSRISEAQREEALDKARRRITKEQADKADKPVYVETHLLLTVSVNNSHQRAFKKEQEAAAWASALGIKETEYNEGDAFDERLQMQKRQEKMQQRLEEEKQRLKVCHSLSFDVNDV